MAVDIQYALEQSRKYREQLPPMTEVQKEAELQHKILRMQEDRKDYAWLYEKPEDKPRSLAIIVGEAVYSDDLSRPDQVSHPEPKPIKSDFDACR